MKRTPKHIDYDKCVIEIRDLKKAFGDFEVLKGVNFHLYEGENLVVLGRSGTGKSVLFKIIAGLLDFDEGEVKVLGKEVDKLSEKELEELRLQLGFSFQSAALYDSMTVRENLLFPLQRHNRKMGVKERDKKIAFILDSVGLLHTLNQMPSSLSGGQRKRIGIARTLILEPTIMLYDEPTAGLDPITSLEINNLINQVQEQFKSSSIIITHDLTCARSTGDRIKMLLDGRFQREGTFDEVFDTDDPRVQAFYDYNFTD
ncbi:MAG: ATP-binding cassette domain-containing protein [Bacteroidota bacterium]|nr:ATP-binding cassette domain-containing protein [Bacteroidota bacterium]